MSVSSENPERDDRWFERMVADELPVVLAYASRRVRDPDDVAAEVFATAWRHRDKLPNAVRPWLLRTASHQIMHATRSVRRRAMLADRAANLGAAPIVGDHAETVSSQLDAANKIDAAMVNLRPSDREILRLHAWEQLNIAEISYILECSHVAAKVRLHRANRRLAALVIAASAPPGTATPTTSMPKSNQPTEVTR
jgi:RNA polymerase sigma-70 factor (ECF subfamily)